MSFYLDEYTELVKSELLELETVTDVILFSGDIGDSDMDKINITAGYSTILLTNIGGQVSRGPGPQDLECDVRFGVYVISDYDSDTLGHSPLAMRTAQEIAYKIANQRFKTPQAGATRIPEILELSAMPGAKLRDKRCAAWFLIWTQRILLRK